MAVSNQQIYNGIAKVIDEAGYGTKLLVAILVLNRILFAKVSGSIFAMSVGFYLWGFMHGSNIKSLTHLAVFSGVIALLIWVVGFDVRIDFFAFLHRATRYKLKPKHQRRQPFYIAPRFEYRQPDSQGCIYLMRRKKDGIYKVGKTVNVSGRLPALFETYGELEPVAYWFVADVDGSEKQALAMTKRYFHAERRHRELRAMTERQTYQFVARFTDLLRG